MTAWPAPLRRARLDLLQTHGYLGLLLERLQPVEFEQATLAVDAHGRLFYGPACFDKWSAVELMSVLYHETWHLLHRHLERFISLNATRLTAGKSGLDERLWNLACDLAINGQIVQEPGIQLPKGGAFPKDFKLPYTWTTEEYYAHFENIEPALRALASQGACGSLAVYPRSSDPDREAAARAAGADKLSRGTLRDVLDAVGLAIEQEAMEKQKLRLPTPAEIYAGVPSGTFSSGGYGSMPGHVQRWADARRASQYDWRRHLSGQLGDLTRTNAGGSRFTYRRPSRRQSAAGTSGILLAGRVAALPDVMVYADTSGSMGSVEQGALGEVVRQVPVIVAACGGRARFAALDTQATQVSKVGTRSRLGLTGGGGTDMRVAIVSAQMLVPRPEIVLILTDGESPWGTPRPTGMRVLVGLIARTVDAARETARRYGVPNWITVIPIPQDRNDA